MAAVVIVGGGLMGLSTAFHLRRLDPGVEVKVLERASVGAAASGASAAGVRAMGRDPAERRLALESLGRWPGLDRELEAATGYRRGGGLRRSGPPSNAPTASRWRRSMRHRCDAWRLALRPIVRAVSTRPSMGRPG